MAPTTVDVVICRACICECNEYKSLYKQGLLMGEVTTLGSLLAFCTSLEVAADESNSLPSYICSNCVYDLIKSYIFKKKVLRANELFGAQMINNAATIEERHAKEDVIFVSEADADLQELAEAAQMKREQLRQEIFNVHENDNGEEYLQLTVLENEGDSENPHQDHEETEIVEMEYIEQEVAETTEIYHTTIITEEIQHIDDNEDDLEQDQEHQHIEDVEDEEDDKVEYEIQVNDIDDEYAELLTDSQDGMSQQSFKRAVDDTTNSGSENSLLNPMHPRRRRTNSNNKPANPDNQCKICGKQLSNSSSFKYHMKLHSDETPYKCEVCGEAFKTRNAYDGHKSTHNPNNPNTCKLCGKSYRQPSSLRMHMQTHAGIKPFTCEVCGKSLTQKSGYKKHMLTHTGEKPYSCDICGKSFCISSNMLVHRRSHTGQKQHQCLACDKSFLTAEQLKRHLVIHSNERPYSCNVCGKQFKRQSAWRSHLQTHQEVRTEKEYELLYSDEYEENNQEKAADIF